ncbi:MAG TPA: crosslink repair DNA glycosylase YcaQ family protein [Pyrinomonadaceae bacterium]|nr:crosslink repair DNA glycosylase YcaQ family protein [Pyrinomonadaceae bacterium]
MTITLNYLRRFTVARNFFKPTTLKRALHRLCFVQADPIRAPARAQDLILRHRVNNYRSGDLERRYAELGVEEDVFVNYGYVTRALQRLMHPRSDSCVPADDVGKPWPLDQRKRAQLLFEFVNKRGTVHPREVDQYFSHGRVTNYWGGSSNATTHLLDAMHYIGMLRIARREKGVRIYAAQEFAALKMSEPERQAHLDALANVVIRIYAPLPGPSLSFYLRRLRYAAPQWKGDLPAALARAKERLSHSRVDGIDWYWPQDESVRDEQSQDTVRIVAPFDSLVHDRARFEKLWGWVYRFEAYTPAVKRKLGYYAMPLLWRDSVIGWANLSINNGKLVTDLGYVGSVPRGSAYKRELELELDRLRTFLDLKV